MMEQPKVCDVLALLKGDIVYYYCHENGNFMIENGTLKEDNLYEEGAKVHGEGWKQYVSKYFICKVERNGVVIFEQ